MAWARRRSAGWLPPALSSKARPSSGEAAVIRETIVLAALAISSPEVVDGDTVRIAGVSIRLTDYDSPKLYSPKCPATSTLGGLGLEKIIEFARTCEEVRPLPH